MDPSIRNDPNHRVSNNPTEFPLPPPPMPQVITPPLISVTTPDFPPPPPTIIVPEQEDLSGVDVVPTSSSSPTKNFQTIDTEIRIDSKTFFKKRDRRSYMVNPISGAGSRKRSSETSSLIPPDSASHTKMSGVIGAEEAENGVGICGLLLTGISWLLVIVTLPFSLCVCFKVVQEYERAVIFRLGRLLQGGSRGPGIFFVLPCIESYQKVDLRTITLGVPPQEVLTKDSVTVSVDAVVYYRVSNATVSVANVENAHHSTRLLAQTTLRNILGTKNLHEILSDRESISGSMQAALDEATEPWGIKVERVEIKDVRLPVQLQRAMAAEAEAAREARAKVIAAEGEQKASRALRDASDVMAGSSSALQLRYLQTLNTISAEKNSTIVFPLPIDILSHLLKPKED